MTDIEKLLAIDEIKRLRGRYLRLLDSKKFEEAKTNYAPGATMQIEVEAPGITFEGGHNILEMAANSMVDVVSVHHAHTPEITLLSETTASGIWGLEDTLWFGPDSHTPGKKIQSYGYLNDTYERVDGAWKLKTVLITRLRINTTMETC